MAWEVLIAFFPGSAHSDRSTVLGLSLLSGSHFQRDSPWLWQTVVSDVWSMVVLVILWVSGTVKPGCEKWALICGN